MNLNLNKNLRSLLILATLSLVTILAVYWALIIEPFPPPIWNPRDFGNRFPNHIRGDIELYYTIRTMVTTINATLASILLAIYVDIYRKTRSEFTIGLSMFSIVLLLYALSSNPLVHWIFGFRAVGLGPFAMLPDLFACMALSILLYLSIKY